MYLLCVLYSHLTSNLHFPLYSLCVSPLPYIAHLSSMFVFSSFHSTPPHSTLGSLLLLLLSPPLTHRPHFLYPFMFFSTFPFSHILTSPLSVFSLSVPQADPFLLMPFLVIYPKHHLILLHLSYFLVSVLIIRPRVYPFSCVLHLLPLLPLPATFLFSHPPFTQVPTFLSPFTQPGVRVEGHYRPQMTN